eukprot:CAMPEP_0197653034 /NCGR_PEP_ID=MMETSP1338-20131121/34809_1 /TAXON_ID=43686 ORGANISM="Pelagodinium beii, Strain RCC1491" /NCGR_SAMPLE_ID=MMETSP1338 /ASSEMBLY_ACC=CAM_ASM_000754 /LENGTH=104 /DNA_ID=CAMNT_0043228027 /DNA_START=83 /DNA_END=393 /DNA_ORIENTATION=+
MASSSKAVMASAGVAALCAGTAFVAPAPQSATPHLRAQVSSSSSSSTPNSFASATTAAVGGLAVAAAATGALRRNGASKYQVVATKAFEEELGVQAPVGFWDPV